MIGKSGSLGRTTLRLTLLLASWLLLAVLSGCSLAPAVAPSPTFDSEAIAGTYKRRLTLTPDDARQREQILFGVIRFDRTGLRAVLLTPYGQRLVTLVHDADGSRYQPGDAPQKAALPLPPEWLASRLEWCLWPLAALQETFAGSAWKAGIEGDWRVIRHHGETIARITPATTDASRTETVLLDDRQGEYRLRISPFEEASP